MNLPGNFSKKSKADKCGRISYRKHNIGRKHQVFRINKCCHNYKRHRHGKNQYIEKLHYSAVVNFARFNCIFFRIHSEIVLTIIYY